MAHVETALADHGAHRRRKLEQAQGVGHRAAILAHAQGERLLGVAVLGDHVLEGLGLLDGVQILALEVLHERHLEGL